MVGLNGAAFKDGLSVMAWEVNAVIAPHHHGPLLPPAFFFAPGSQPFHNSSSSAMTPRQQSIANTIFLLAYALILIPLILYIQVPAALST